MKTLSILTIAAALTLAVNSNEPVTESQTRSQGGEITVDVRGVVDSVIDDVAASAKTFRDWTVVICGKGRFFFMFDDALEDTDDCVVVDVF